MLWRENSAERMIQSFRDERARRLFDSERVWELASIEDQARTRLLRLDAAVSLEDLAAIRGNRLEAPRGDRKGQYNIRVKDRYRICFIWSEKGPTDVEIVDSHSVRKSKGETATDSSGEDSAGRSARRAVEHQPARTGDSCTGQSNQFDRELEAVHYGRYGGEAGALLRDFSAVLA
jgi:proteic killer suppression protein